MSVFSAMNTAVSGLTAQSVAFSNISNNIANSQTVGYKAVDTSFSDYVEASGALAGQSGNVLATTQYANQVSGPVTGSSLNGSMAVNGNGFLLTSEVNGLSTATNPAFSNTQYYTRAGNFASDRNGFLVNSAGGYLDGYMVDATTGALNTSKLTQINVNNVKFRPTVTTSVSMAPTLADVSAAVAGLPGAPQTSIQTVYDSAGTSYPLGMSWVETAGSDGTTTPPSGSTWTLTVTGTALPAGTPAPSASVVFDTTGRLQSITPAGGSPVTSGSALFNIGSVGLDTTTINLDLGTIGSSSGTTVSTTPGASFIAGTPVQDGVGSGNFVSFAIQTDGSVVGTFDNGQSQLIAKVPLALFGNANALQAQDGQAYTATVGSGPATIAAAGNNGAGSFETQAVEGSTTSLDTDLTKLIVAQQAYGASAKVVTTANEMLQSALAMKQ